MNALYSHPAFQLYAACSAVLIVGLYFLAVFTGYTRSGRKMTLNAEDMMLYAGSHVVEHEHADVQRVKRAHMNLIESALPFFAIGLLYALTEPNLVMARVLFFTFVGVRLLHAVFYLTARQPARFAAFAVGGLVNLAMVVQVFRAAL